MDDHSHRAATMEKNKQFRKSQLLIIAIAAAGLFCCNTSETGPDETNGYLSFSTVSPVRPVVQGDPAEIVISASGGTLPYTFFIIPETQWQAGDMMHEMLTRNDFSRLHRYEVTRKLYGSHKISAQVQPGTSSIARYYWVAVQDEAENGTLSGTNMLAWWKRVAVYDL